MTSPRDDANTCFVCGPDNPEGLQIKFRLEDGLCRAEYTPPPKFCGYDDVTHGGILFGLLDDDAIRAVCGRGVALQGQGVTVHDDARGLVAVDDVAPEHVLVAAHADASMAVVTPGTVFSSSATPRLMRSASCSASIFSRCSRARIWSSSAVASSKPSMEEISSGST